MLLWFCIGAVLAESPEDSYAVGVNWLRMNHQGDILGYTLVSNPALQDEEA